MASSESSMKESKFSCPICLDTITYPVTTPCGHNFCKHCIESYWDSSDIPQCPMCKEEFYKRPDLRVNTSFKEVIDQFKCMSIRGMKHPTFAGPKDVACDVCTGVKLKAVMSCLVCLTSYCETHREPHQRVLTLKRHKQVEPVGNLEERICKEHGRLREMYCQNDQAFLCQLCADQDHANHFVLTVEKESAIKKAQVKHTEVEVQQRIDDNQKMVVDIKLSTELSRKSANAKFKDSTELFSALMKSISSIHAELHELIEKMQIEAESQADRLVKELEEEIDHLQGRAIELEQLSQTEDHVHLIQRCTGACTPPQGRNWKNLLLDKDLYLGLVERGIYAIQDSVLTTVKALTAAELNQMKQYAVDLTLDARTAGPWLTVSPDGKEVRKLSKKQKVDKNPDRFIKDVFVLANQWFSSGKHYWEVVVRDKPNWFLGVAQQSVNRKELNMVNPKQGFWSLCLIEGKYIQACTGAAFSLILVDGLPMKVGLFVNYEGG